MQPTTETQLEQVSDQAARLLVRNRELYAALEEASVFLRAGSAFLMQSDPAMSRHLHASYTRTAEALTKENLERRRD